MKHRLFPKAGGEVESAFLVHIFSFVLDLLVALYTSLLWVPGGVFPFLPMHSAHICKHNIYFEAMKRFCQDLCSTPNFTSYHLGWWKFPPSCFVRFIPYWTCVSIFASRLMFRYCASFCNILVCTTSLAFSSHVFKQTHPNPCMTFVSLSN